MRKFIKTVTVTGADDSIQPTDLLSITEAYPFVEWGILFSKSSEGRARFPTHKWVQHLIGAVLLMDLENSEAVHPKFSAHLCGRWVRDFCNGTPSVVRDIGSLLCLFERMQLNFHSFVHTIKYDAFNYVLGMVEGNKIACANPTQNDQHVQFIFQLDNVNDGILDISCKSGVDAVGLFDLSGGAGVLPDTWPTSDHYMGYAGGLSPENVAAQIALIEPLCNTDIWIDAETHLRSDNDAQFDLDKVVAFLEAAKPWVIDG